MKKLLTIGIPVYNGAKHLLTYFDKSYLDNEDIEYLILDDGSKDNTLEVANELASKHKNITVVHQENKGCGIGYETIIKNVKGEYFHILDCDDYLEKDTLLEDIKKMKELKNDDIDVFINHFIYKNQNGKSKLDFISEFVEPNKIIDINSIKKFSSQKFFMKHNLLIRTKLFKEHELKLPVRFYCDNLLVAFVLMYANKYYFIDKTLYHYRIGTGEQSVSNESMAKNYEEHLKCLDIITDIVNKDNYKKLKTKHHKQMVLHFVFIVAFLSVFSTYLKYNKERTKVYKSYLKNVKKKNSYVYKKMVRSTVFKFLYLIPRPILGKFLVYGKRKFAKDIAWDF